MLEKQSNDETVNPAEENDKKKPMPRQMRYVVATAIVLLSLLGLSAGFLLRVYFMTESACYDALAVETEDAIAELEGNLRSDRTMLRVIAGLIGSTGDIGSLEVSGYLSNYDINSLVTQIGVLLPGDEWISSKGRRSNLDKTMRFEPESALGEHISGIYVSGNESSSAVIRSYVPIWKDGICIGLLFSTASSSSIAKAWLPNVYDKKGYCYVVNRKTGEVIINTASDQIRNIQDISFAQASYAYTKEGTINAILEGKKGYSVYGSSTGKYYMCYLPFSIEDWEMVTFVPESAVFSAVSPVRNGLYALTAMAAILLMIYGVWLLKEIRSSILETEQKANIDVLTGLPNRNRYEAYLKRLDGSKERLTCLFIDANGLHELNNSKGHFAGDQMLRFIADTLKVLFGGEHIYRIGGDEFVVFLTGKTKSEIYRCLEEFHKTMQRNEYHAAVGTCDLLDGMSVNQLIGNAEKAMYSDKEKYYAQIGKVMRV